MRLRDRNRVSLGELREHANGARVAAKFEVRIIGHSAAAIQSAS